MSAFDSIAKKLAIPLVVLFEIGWIVYVGGFGSYMREQVRDGEQRGENADEVLREPVLFPFYFTGWRAVCCSTFSPPRCAAIKNG